MTRVFVSTRNDDIGPFNSVSDARQWATDKLIENYNSGKLYDTDFSYTYDASYFGGNMVDADPYPVGFIAIDLDGAINEGQYYKEVASASEQLKFLYYYYLERATGVKDNTISSEVSEFVRQTALKYVGDAMWYQFIRNNEGSFHYSFGNDKGILPEQMPTFNDTIKALRKSRYINDCAKTSYSYFKY